jgi:hypothetical protein
MIKVIPGYDFFKNQSEIKKLIKINQPNHRESQQEPVGLDATNYNRIE